MLSQMNPRMGETWQIENVSREARRLASAMVLLVGLLGLMVIPRGHYWSDLGDYFASLTSPINKNEQKQEIVGDTAEPATAEKVGHHRVLAQFLAKRYSVSQDVIGELVQTAYAAGRRVGLDPLLIIAVMAIESRFNPIAESIAGAKGLMQVIPKYHADKLEEFGGERAVFDPRVNILIGSKILKDYIAQTGNLKLALQMYAGATDDAQDIYTNRVLSEKLRLQRIVSQIPPSAKRTSSSSATDQRSQSSPL